MQITIVPEARKSPVSLLFLGFEPATLKDSWGERNNHSFKETDMTTKRIIRADLEPPAFPTAAAYPNGSIFRDYHILLEDHCIRGVPAFDFAPLLSLAGTFADKCFRVDHGHRPMTLRMYTTSVGPTGSHKSVRSDPIVDTMWDLMMKPLNGSTGKKPFTILKGFTTDAGLVDVLAENVDTPVFLYADELQGFMAAAAYPNSSLMYQLNDLWNGPSSISRNLTKRGKTEDEKKKLTAQLPIFGMHGNIQPDTFWRCMGANMETAANGFLNRFAFFVGGYDDIHRAGWKPYNIEEYQIQWIQERLSELYNSGSRIILDFSPKAALEWRRYTLEFEKRLRGYYYGNWTPMVQRVPDQGVRMAGIFAALNGNTEIGNSHVERAIALANYLEASIDFIMKSHQITSGPQRLASIEEQAIRKLKKACRCTEQPIQARDIVNSFASTNRVSTQDIRRIFRGHDNVDSVTEWGGKSFTAARYRYNAEGIIREPDAEGNLDDIVPPVQVSQASPNSPGVKAVAEEKEREQEKESRCELSTLSPAE
jgi:hypothetical protein